MKIERSRKTKYRDPVTSFRFNGLDYSLEADDHDGTHTLLRWDKGTSNATGICFFGVPFLGKKTRWLCLEENSEEVKPLVEFIIMYIDTKQAMPIYEFLAGILNVD